MICDYTCFDIHCTLLLTKCGFSHQILGTDSLQTSKHLMVCYLVSVPTMQHSTILILKHRKTKLYINNKRFN